MKKSIWIVVTLLAFNCATEDYKPGDEEKCRVGNYVYGQKNGVDVRYEITYVENSQTWADVIKDEIQVGSDWATNVTYKHIYRNDSIYIKDFKQFKEGETFLAAQLGTNLQAVVTDFPDNNGKYRFTFDYSQTDQITVTLEKIVGNVATFDSRGVYYLDDLNDVTKLVITQNPDVHGNDPDPFTTREITYTYDIVLNPLKDLVLPHFMKAKLPDITYFSMNNRLTEKYGSTTNTYKFDYGTDPMPTKQTKPDGVIEKYEYPNCTN